MAGPFGILITDRGILSVLFSDAIWLVKKVRQFLYNAHKRMLVAG